MVPYGLIKFAFIDDGSLTVITTIQDPMPIGEAT